MTKTLRSAATGFLLLLSHGHALSAEWVPVGTDGDVVHYVDAQSIERSGEVVRVTKRAVYREPHPIGDVPGMPLMKETSGVVECDCRRLQHRAVSVSIVGADGQVLYTSGEMKRVWESIDESSPGRATLDYACAHVRQ